MKQHSMPIGPLDEQQAALTARLTTKRRPHVHLDDLPFGTMFLVRVGYRLIQIQFRKHSKMGPYPSPRYIADELETLGVRGIWPALWFQIDWLAQCWEHGIKLTDARDYGPSKLWTGSSAIPPAVRRAYRR